MADEQTPGHPLSGAVDGGVVDPDGGRGIAARLLRGLGALVLVASLSVFLFQRWSELGDLGRYGLLLAQTVVLMVTGFACAQWLREPKGARAFVAVALVAVVACFAVLGGLVWSQFQWLGSPGTYPDSLVWQAVSAAWVLGVAAVSLGVLTPISRVGFTILARASARPLTGLFLASCALLLVPVREPWAVAALALAAVAAFAAFARRGVARDPALRTLEGGFALLLPLAPVAVVLGRGVWFYPGADLLFAVAATLMVAILREISLRLAGTQPWARVLDRISATTALLAGAGWAVLVASHGPDELFLPVFGLVAGGLIGELSLRARDGRTDYRLLAASVASGSVALNALLLDGVIAAAIALVVGIAVAAQAVATRHPWLLVAALVAGLAGLGDLVAMAIGTVELGAWGWLAVIGTAAILAGSALERGLFSRAAARWRGHPAVDGR